MRVGSRTRSVRSVQTRGEIAARNPCPLSCLFCPIPMDFNTMSSASSGHKLDQGLLDEQAYAVYSSTLSDPYTNSAVEPPAPCPLEYEVATLDDVCSSRRYSKTHKAVDGDQSAFWLRLNCDAGNRLLDPRSQWRPRVASSSSTVKLTARTTVTTMQHSACLVAGKRKQQ